MSPNLWIAAGTALMVIGMAIGVLMATPPPKEVNNIMDPATATICAAIFGAIVSAILTGSVTYFFSTRLMRQSHKNTIGVFKRQEFNKAAAQFRNAFLGEILYLRDNVKINGVGSSIRINEFLNTAAISKHMQALVQFEPFLNAKERERMYRAWDEYCHIEGTPQDQNEKRDFRFNDYMNIEYSKGREEAKNIALQNINKILEVAGFK